MLVCAAFVAGSALLGEPRPGLRHLDQCCLVGRIKRGPREREALRRTLPILLPVLHSLDTSTPGTLFQTNGNNVARAMLATRVGISTQLS